MPRLARLDASGVLHHIMGRGIEKTKNRPLSSSMRKILTGYAVNFNKRHRRYGHLFQEVTSGLDGMIKRNLRVSGRRIDFDTLAERVCKNYDISAGGFRSGSRRHKVVKARQVLFWFGVRELVYSGAEVARYLGVSTSYVNRFISLGKKPDADFNIHA